MGVNDGVPLFHKLMFLPVWAFTLFALYFAAVGFLVGYAVAALRRPPPGP